MGQGGRRPFGKECPTSLLIVTTHRETHTDTDTDTHTHTHTHTHIPYMGLIPGNRTQRGWHNQSAIPLQSTVSESTLIALLAARKNKILAMKACEPDANESSLNARLVAYTSDQVSCLIEATPSCQGLALGVLALV